jgi:type I restriction-modification system DNA methylase subunit
MDKMNENKGIDMNDTIMYSEIAFINSENLKSYIHDMHNFMRNNGIGYGQTAIKVFNIFYGLKLIQKNLHSLDFLSDEQKKILDYNELYKMAINKRPDFTSYLDRIVLQLLFDLLKDKKDKKKSNFGYFLYHQFPTDCGELLYAEIVKKISKIPVGYTKEKKVNLSGKVWEYFIGRDDTAISELGAYFTDRNITNFIFKILSPQLKEDGNIKTMIDPFGGSGGFTLGYANYLRDNFDNINWETNVNGIKHFDMEETVTKMAGLEIFAITGHFPNNENNFKKINTFSSNFNEKFDYVITNPPYGGDKLSKSSNQMKIEIILNKLKEDNDKIEEELKGLLEEADFKELKKTFKSLNQKDLESGKKYQRNKTGEMEYKFEQELRVFKKKYLDDNDIIEKIDKYDNIRKQISYWRYKNQIYIEEQEKLMVKLNNCSKFIRNFASSHDIKKEQANDKEACSLLLLMNLLAENGTCCAVLKEGLFFNNKYSTIRQLLIENYNVTDVISVPQSAFENTSTKTSIIIFHNNGRTKRINFSEIHPVFQENDLLIDDPEANSIINDIENEYNNRKDESNYKNALEAFKSFNFKNSVYVSALKGEIRENEMVHNYICSATYKQISAPTIIKNKKGQEVERFDYSLNYKNYQNLKTPCPEGYELKKLDKIIKFNGKSKRLAEFANDNGKYRYYSSGNTILRCNKADFINELSIIIGHSGNGCIFLDNTFSTLITNHVLQSENKILLNYIYHYIKFNWDYFYNKCYKASTVSNTSNEKISNFEIPVPKDLDKLKKPLETLYELHQNITEDTEAIPQKEKAICELIKKLTEEGKEGIDYDEHKLGDVCDLQDGYDFYRNEMDSDNYYKPGINLPLLKINDDEIKDYVNINEKYKKYVVNNGDLVIGTKGSCGNIRQVNIIKGYHKHGLLKFVNIKINKNYIYYLVKSKFDKEYIKNNTNESVLSNMKKDNILNTKLKVLKPSIMKKHKFQELFDEIDTLKERLETNKKEYQNQLNILFKPFTDLEEEPEEKNQVNKEDEKEDTEEEPEEKPKAKKVTSKKQKTPKSDSEDEEEEDIKPKAKKVTSKKQKTPKSDTEEDEDIKPKVKKIIKKKQPTPKSDTEDEEPEENPKAKKVTKKKTPKNKTDEDDSDEKSSKSSKSSKSPKLQKSAKSKKQDSDSSESSESEEDEKPAKNKTTKKSIKKSIKNTKPVESDNSDSDTSIKSTKSAKNTTSNKKMVKVILKKK